MNARVPIPAPLSPADAADLRAPLLDWYARTKRDLPWRRTRDPYAIWISEAMLQQTRALTVQDAWRRFLERFPDVRALAAASEDEVVAAWSGLGYYNRARTLRRAAATIVAEHGARFPADPQAARALPGVGEYTAGAVLSIAYGAAEPLVDGNVARVFARLFALEAPLEDASTQRALWGLARALVPPPADDPVAADAPGSWNQALMELGALLCLPRAPRCSECPLAERCSGRARGIEAELPRRRPRRAALDVRLELFVVCRDGLVLLVRRPAAGRMAGMWELPTREVSGPGLWPAQAADGALALEPQAPLFELSHAITHHRIQAAVRAARLEAEPTPTPETRWVAPASFGELGLTGLARKVLARLTPSDREPKGARSLRAPRSPKSRSGRA